MGYGAELGRCGRLDVGLDRPEAVAALRCLSAAIHVQRIARRACTTYQEEEARHTFQDGRAVFLRNWPYVWPLAQARTRRCAAGSDRADGARRGRQLRGHAGRVGARHRRFSRSTPSGLAVIRVRDRARRPEIACLRDRHRPDRAGR